MARFISLKKIGAGDPILINIDHVAYVVPSKENAKIHFAVTDLERIESVTVAASFDEVASLMVKA